MRLLLMNIVHYTVYILQIILLLRVLISWLAPYTRNDFTEIIYSITEPILQPFRMILPLGYSRIDISPILAYIALNLIKKLIFFLIF